MKKICLQSIIALVVLISSCKKDNTIGANLLPADDLLNAKFSDTFSLNVKTIDDTFLRTDKLVYNYLGVINDAKFGTQNASIVMELDRPTNIFDDTLGIFTVDSAILFLKYNTIYGDTLTAQNFEVSTINNPINETQAYYSNNTSFAAATPIGTLSNYMYAPRTNRVNTSTTDTLGTLGLVRIVLDKNWIQNNLLNLGQNVLRDSLLFKTAFKGIRIDNVGTNGNAMAEIDLGSIQTSLTIFYKNKYNVVIVSKLYPSILRVENGAVVQRTNSINLFSKSLSSTVNTVIGSAQVSDSINYMLGQGGTLIKVSMPTLANLGKVAVNKAVLQVTQIIPNTQILTTPLTIFLLKRNINGQLNILPSYNAGVAENYAKGSGVTPEGLGYTDSVFNDNLGNKMVRYSIKVSNYIQNISKELETNTDLYIAYYQGAGTDGTKNLLGGFSYTPVRLIFAGSNYSDPRYKMKLNFTYTKIE